MTTEELLNQGDVQAALLQLQSQIRSNPAKAELRTFLFQLLVVLGEWERALTQLNVVGELDASSLAMVSMYRQVIACERLREEVFLGKKDPIIFGKPNEWVALLVQALKLTAQGEYLKSQALRDQAFATAPATSGKMDEQPFAWLADSDSRIGPVIEAMVDGRYLWVPVENIASIVIDEPADLRDVVWIPAHFKWLNGGESYGVLPSRYPFSYQHDSLIALSRKTEWQDCGDDLFLGIGQKILATDVDEYALMDVRSIQFDNAPIEEEATQGG
ncbi:MAG: type VI secretion system protein ImpE [Methyloprofundus sp.]|nr:MAG: type VI secretion system protein ImpE [Methyloprofundus sp.]